MKKIMFLLGAIFLFSPMHNTWAAECDENDKTCLCSQAWSRGFDAMHEYQKENVIAPFFSQNDIAPADMFSGIRAVKMSYSCGMQSICSAVQFEGKQEELKLMGLSPSNGSGGAIPSDFSMCRMDTTLAEDLGKLENYEEIRADIEKNCSLGETPQQREEIQQMYALCSEHANITGQVFEYTLQNMLWRDVNRKVNGYFHKKVYDFVAKLKDLQDTANSFVNNANAAYGKLCSF